MHKARQTVHNAPNLQHIGGSSNRFFIFSSRILKTACSMSTQRLRLNCCLLAVVFVENILGAWLWQPQLPPVASCILACHSTRCSIPIPIPIAIFSAIPTARSPFQLEWQCAPSNWMQPVLPLRPLNCYLLTRVRLPTLCLSSIRSSCRCHAASSPSASADEQPKQFDISKIELQIQAQSDVDGHPRTSCDHDASGSA